MTFKIDKVTIEKALKMLGQELLDRKVMAEIAVFGGAALIIQFGWRPSTRDVDIKLLTPTQHGEVERAAKKVAQALGLPRSWINEDVAAFLRDEQPEGSLLDGAFYPTPERPALRVRPARPEYLLAMKLAALERLTIDDRDYADARNLATHLGITTEPELMAAYNVYFLDRPLSESTRARVRDLAEDLYAASLTPTNDT